jgi:hypothetical protein
VDARGEALLANFAPILKVCAVQQRRALQ